MGHSCGGLTSKLHALVDAEGRPVVLRLTAGQVADCKEAEALIDSVGEGDILLADKDYDSSAICARLPEKSARTNIPPRSNRKGNFVFSKWVYRQRNLVKRFFNRIEQFRGVAIRYDKDPPTTSPRQWDGARVYESAAQPAFTSSISLCGAI